MLYGAIEEAYAVGNNIKKVMENSDKYLNFECGSISSEIVSTPLN